MVHRLCTIHYENDDRYAFDIICIYSQDQDTRLLSFSKPCLTTVIAYHFDMCIFHKKLHHLLSSSTYFRDRPQN